MNIFKIIDFFCQMATHIEEDVRNCHENCSIEMEKKYITIQSVNFYEFCIQIVMWVFAGQFYTNIEFVVRRWP